MFESEVIDRVRDSCVLGAFDSNELRASPSATRLDASLFLFNICNLRFRYAVLIYQLDRPSYHQC